MGGGMTMLSAAEIASMRGTVEDVALMMTCTIERHTEGDPDEYGQPSGFWDVIYSNVPCLYWIEDRATDAEITGPNVSYVFSHQMVQFEANFGVHEGDRVLSVIGVDGTQIAGPLNVQEVRHRVTDTVLVVEEVR
jgi:hypothetical protein